MTSYLNILSIPEGAQIFIDGMDTNLVTPTLTPFILEPGFHSYVLILLNYESVFGQIILVDNETYTLAVTLTSNMMQLYEKFVLIGAAALGVSILSLIFHKK